MGWHRDNSGVPHTCPYIDDVIAFIESFDEETSKYERAKIIDTLEDIRGFNLKLRDYGISLEESLTEIGEERDDLIKENAELKDDLYDTRDELKEANSKIDTLEDEIYRLSQNN